MDFVFEKKHRDICYDIFKNSSDYSPLCTLAEITANIEGNKYQIPDDQITPLKAGVEQGIVTIEDGKAFFTEDIYCIFFLALKNIEDFKEVFDNNELLLKKIEDFTFKYPFKISSIIPAMIMVILDNLYDLPVLEKLVSFVDILDEDDFRSIFNFIVPTIPYINTTNEKILSLIEKINVKYTDTIKFLDSFVLFEAFHIFAIEKPIDAEKLIDEIKDKTYTREVLINLFTGLSNNPNYDFSLLHKKAFELIEDTTFINFQTIIIACAKLNYNNHPDFKEKTYNRFVELTKNDDPKILADITRGFNYFCGQEPRSKDWLIHFSKSNIKDILEEVAWSLHINNRKSNEDWYKEVLLNLTALREHNNNIVFALYNYLQSEPELVFNFINKWIEEETNFTKISITRIFPNIFPEIYNNHKKTLEKYITRWLNNDNPVIHSIIEGIFYDLRLHNSDLELDQEELNLLSDIDIKYIALKIMGYTYGKELLCSLVFSLLKRKPQSNFVNILVKNAFIEYISYNFPGYSSEFLKEKSKSGTDLEISRQILEDIEKKYKLYDELTPLKELEGSNERVKYYNKIQNKAFQIKYDQDDGNYIHKLFPITKLKGGKSFFLKYDGSYRDKSPLVQHIAKEEISKGDSIDPIGMENLRMTWRMYERERK